AAAALFGQRQGRQQLLDLRRDAFPVLLQGHDMVKGAVRADGRLLDDQNTRPVGRHRLPPPVFRVGLEEPRTPRRPAGIDPATVFFAFVEVTAGIPDHGKTPCTRRLMKVCAATTENACPRGMVTRHPPTPTPCV